jgi:hypothetical protein
MSNCGLMLSDVQLHASLSAVCACWLSATADDQPSGCDAAAAAGTGGGDAGGVLDSSAAWIKLAAQLPADIQQQPSMVKGGQLREYQMQVRHKGCNGCLHVEISKWKCNKTLGFHQFAA